MDRCQILCVSTYFLVVLWTKDHDGAGKTTLPQPVTGDSALSALRKGVDAMAGHQRFLDYFKCKLSQFMADFFLIFKTNI